MTNKFLSKVGNVIKSAPNSFRKMSIGKKVYFILWTMSMLILASLIGLFGGLSKKFNEKPNLEVVRNSEIKDSVFNANKDKTQYFVQYTSNIDKNINNNVYKTNNFYTLSQIENDKISQSNFDISSFYVKGYHEDKAIEIGTNTNESVKVIYDKAPSTNQKVARDAYFKKYDLKAISKDKSKSIYLFNESLTSGAKTATNATAAVGGIFVLTLSAAIMATVITSVKEKKTKGGAS